MPLVLIYIRLTLRALPPRGGGANALFSQTRLFNAAFGMQREAQEAKKQAVQRAMPNLLPWQQRQQRLVQESFQQWGYVCFVSKEVQRTPPAQLETFWQHFDGVIWNSFRGTGARDVLGSRWHLQVVVPLSRLRGGLPLVFDGLFLVSFVYNSRKQFITLPAKRTS